VRPCGDTALLVEVADLAQVLGLHAAIESRRHEPGFAGLADLVPAATTLLLIADRPTSVPRLREHVGEVLRHLDSLVSQASAARDTETVRIAVRYTGPDLEEVAELTGLTPQEVVRAHTSQPWTVGFCGFAPGFSYLVGGDPRLEVPRRAEPRTSVPAGAVGLAGSFSGIYPRSSPGGWQIIGQTEAVLWDVERQPPALLQPGSRVVFVDAGASTGPVAEAGDA
jgi:KipI family sensor histidine kinase inhibitor